MESTLVTIVAVIIGLLLLAIAIPVVVVAAVFAWELLVFVISLVVAFFWTISQIGK